MGNWDTWTDETWMGNPARPANYVGTDEDWGNRVAFMQRKITRQLTTSPAQLVKAHKRAEGRSRTEWPIQVTKADVAAERERRLAELAVESERRHKQFFEDLEREIAADEAREEAAKLAAIHRRTGARVVGKPAPELRASTVTVGDEPAVYGPGSDHSYLRDRYLNIAFSWGAVPNRRVGDAVETVRRRLGQHARQMQHLARRGSDGERELLRSYYIERNRPWHGSVSDRSKDDFTSLALAELRTVSTASTSMGAVTPPVYLLEQWQLWRTAAAPAAARARQLALPRTGMVVEIPGLTSGVAVTEQPGENLGIGLSTPTSVYRTAAVVTLSGGVPVAQQLLDRIGPGVSFDEIVTEQCAREAATTLDTLVLDALLATAQTITNSGSPGIPSLWADVGKGSSLLKTHEGTRLPPDTLLMPPTNLSWYTAQVDKQTRPIWLPSPAGVAARAGAVDSASEGYSGYTVGGADVYEDANLTLTATDATLVLGNFGRGVLVMTGPPIVDVLPEFRPSQMTALVRFRQYAAIGVLYSKAFCKISGAAYPVAPTFTGA